eukprot:gene9188-biopygen4686
MEGGRGRDEDEEVDGQADAQAPGDRPGWVWRELAGWSVDRRRGASRHALGSQDTGAGVARGWRGRGAGCRHFFGLGWRGRGTGMARACPVTPGDGLQ